MLSFFGLLFGLFYLMIRGTIEIKRREVDMANYVSKVRAEGIRCKKLVSVYGIDNNRKRDYRDNRNNRRVYKLKDSDGIVRWYYADSHKQIPNPINENGYLSFLNRVNNMGLFEDKQKWDVIEEFWEDSIERDEENHDPKCTYLDDFRMVPDVTREERWNKIQSSKGVKGKINSYLSRDPINSGMWFDTPLKPEERKVIRKYFHDNDPLNQKIYLHNMRPYQLAAIYKRGRLNYDTLEKTPSILVYLIRFEKGKLSLQERHNIQDKQNSKLWTKWYAITRKEFESLTNLNTGILWCPDSLKYDKDKELNIVEFYMKQVNLDDVAFLSEVDSVNWYSNNKMEFFGVQKAFDKDGVFIGKE